MPIVSRTKFKKINSIGRAIAQAVSRRFPTRRPGFKPWSGHVEFCDEQKCAGEGFLRELWFSLPIYIPSAIPQSSSLSPKAGTIGQEWPQCQ
jgi:hypothetical protein